jgi:hypothetical protein
MAACLGFPVAVRSLHGNKDDTDCRPRETAAAHGGIRAYLRACRTRSRTLWTEGAPSCAAETSAPGTPRLVATQGRGAGHGTSLARRFRGARHVSFLKALRIVRLPPCVLLLATPHFDALYGPYMSSTPDFT